MLKKCSIMWNQYPIKKITNGFKPLTFVETGCLNVGMCKFESSQKDESKAQSAEPSKAYRKPRAFNGQYIV